VIDILSKFKSPAFIATVLDKGDILQAAVDLNFMHVVGATTSKEDADYCSARFKGIDSVKIFYGEEIILHEVIKDINVAITFCLDTRSEPTPALLQELGILKHPSYQNPLYFDTKYTSFKHSRKRKYNIAAGAGMPP
jgi:hypothetical protein